MTLAVSACGDGSGIDAEGRGLEASEAVADDQSFPSDESVANDESIPDKPRVGADLTVEDLACPHGGAVGKIQVAFTCGEITVVSCKDLSNVVVEFADGTREKFDGLHGQRGVFVGPGAHAGATITGVWVKAGANHSGDGPGYGERFDAPAQECPEVCFIVDGSCTDTPPPPDEEECFIADGVCSDGGIPPPKKPEDDPSMVI